MSQQSKLTAEQQQGIITDLQAGDPQQKIANKYGVSQSCVSLLKKKHNIKAQLTNKNSFGRKPQSNNIEKWISQYTEFEKHYVWKENKTNYNGPTNTN